jgi:ABC-type cobalamin/Fe3+-siderophores transport system ATPase subunit
MNNAVKIADPVAVFRSGNSARRLTTRKTMNDGIARSKYGMKYSTGESSAKKNTTTVSIFSFSY